MRYCKECKKCASYNIEGEPPLYCGEHKLVGMENVIHKKCINVGCKKISTCNKEGEKPLYCGEHKLDGMEDVINKRCIHKNCKKFSSYNKEGEKTPLYCGDHKLVGMEDVKSKRCIHADCKKYATCNIAGKTRLYCIDHKLDGMEDVINNKCIHKDCKTRASYNTEGETTPQYCGEHKHEGMDDVVSKMCKTHLCYTRPSNKAYEGYCLRCFMQTFPGKPVARNHKTKEKDIVDRIKRLFPNFDWKEDRKVSGGCSKKRPDLFLDMGSHVIDVEIDENKHSSYNCSCENKRMMEIYQDAGKRPIIFIRFNPDSYEDVNGKNITSCWGLDGNNIMALKKTKVKEWVERVNALTNQIQHWVDYPTKKEIEIIELFY